MVFDGHAVDELTRILQTLRVNAGNPSYSKIAASVEASVGHVHSVLNHGRPASWPMTRAIATYLGADGATVSVVRELWMAASTRRLDAAVPSVLLICLHAIADGRPIPVRELGQLPGQQAAVLARIAERAGVPLEVGVAADWIRRAADTDTERNGSGGDND
jgi:hypothetical protein